MEATREKGEENMSEENSEEKKICRQRFILRKT